MKKGPIKGSNGILARSEGGHLYVWFLKKDPFDPEEKILQYDVALMAIMDKVMNKNGLDNLTGANMIFMDDDVLVIIGERSGKFAYSEFQGLF